MFLASRNQVRTLLACIIHEFFEFVNKHLQTKKLSLQVSTGCFAPGSRLALSGGLTSRSRSPKDGLFMKSIRIHE